jgi:hypothetical protein
MKTPENKKKYKRLCNIIMIVFCGLFVISIAIQWFSKLDIMNLPTIYFGGMGFLSIVLRLLANKNIVLGN